MNSSVCDRPDCPACRKNRELRALLGIPQRDLTKSDTKDFSPPPSSCDLPNAHDQQSGGDTKGDV